MKVRICLCNDLPNSHTLFINIIEKYSKLSYEKTHELVMPLYLGKSDVVLDIINEDFESFKEELKIININVDTIENEKINDNYLHILLSEIGFEETKNIKKVCETMAHFILDMKEKFPNLPWQTIQQTIEKYK